MALSDLPKVTFFILVSHCSGFFQRKPMRHDTTHIALFIPSLAGVELELEPMEEGGLAYVYLLRPPGIYGGIEIRYLPDQALVCRLDA